MLVKQDDDQEGIALPVTSIKTIVTIKESLAHIQLSQTFFNPSDSSAAELTYRFPKIENTLISRLAINIGDEREIQAKVVEK